MTQRRRSIACPKMKSGVSLRKREAKIMRRPERTVQSVVTKSTETLGRGREEVSFTESRHFIMQILWVVINVLPRQGVHAECTVAAAAFRICMSQDYFFKNTDGRSPLELYPNQPFGPPCSSSIHTMVVRIEPRHELRICQHLTVGVSSCLILDGAFQYAVFPAPWLDPGARRATPPAQESDSQSWP